MPTSSENYTFNALSDPNIGKVISASSTLWCEGYSPQAVAIEDSTCRPTNAWRGVSLTKTHFIQIQLFSPLRPISYQFNYTPGCPIFFAESHSLFASNDGLNGYSLVESGTSTQYALATNLNVAQSYTYFKFYFQDTQVVDIYGIVLSGYYSNASFTNTSFRRECFDNLLRMPSVTGKVIIYATDTLTTTDLINGPSVNTI
eukprot:TRINITY_DN4704_c0_g1_i1.p1 TRINITY_DN4704_c0_g1~~TRINITY_DN4704_c0_g1_i1.p1  ORF type:complete len:201 (-),score=41.82 TRINITY_DN4704_c0_g1_i1:23-625(-)